jgi:CheY-like chemotaxis protein
MRLLIVDDNEVNRRVVCAYLKSLGVPAESIMTAVNGREAAELCDKEYFDLVFMDIQMPEMDGIEATRQILSIKPNQPTIVALTTNTSDEAIKEYYNVGMKMVLSKPIIKQEFLEALKLAM